MKKYKHLEKKGESQFYLFLYGFIDLKMIDTLPGNNDID
jgi:hypothetical protein